MSAATVNCSRWRAVLLLVVPLVWSGTVFSGCAAQACKALSLLASNAGPSAWYFEVCTGGQDAEVFVDGVRWTRACRRSGSRLRCYVGSARGFPHRLEVKVLGRGVLRCRVARIGAPSSCCINCPWKKKAPKKTTPQPEQ